MHLTIRHRTEYAYDPAAAKVSLRLKLFPSIYDGQSVDAWSVHVNDEPVFPIYTTGYGDEAALWQSDETVSQVTVIAEGKIVTEDKAGLVRDLPRKPPSAIFCRSTELTRPDAAITELASAAYQSDLVAAVHAISNAVRAAVVYRPEATTAVTTAAEALSIGAGVCQDHAHVFIAACRSVGVPARYVVGYLKAAGNTEELFETHAWAEAHIANFGWIAVDPSNGISPTDHYVRISCGMDADDATPIKGHVMGGSQISLSADVSILDSQQQ